ncbi:RNA-binding protein [Candidatus Woesearchaeota archaeon]|nr:MAG: RNA-binding protein [Candidatus Woesearchaeota archaeon]
MMGKQLVKDKSIVVPGEVVAEGRDFILGPGVRREGNQIVASRVGLIHFEGKFIRLIALSGRYIPRKDDVIIGRIKEILINGWLVDTESAYPAMLNLRDAVTEYVAKGSDLTRFFDFNDYIVCKIINVTPQMFVDVTTKGPGLKKLVGGRIIKVNPNKVSRIIGKKGSMLNMIKQATGCNIIVGQNGVIWIKSTDPKMELVAVNANKDS